jgi:DNA-binding PadR family transcriptional regulator
MTTVGYVTSLEAAARGDSPAPLWQLHCLFCINPVRGTVWWTATRLAEIGLVSAVEAANSKFARRTYRLSRNGQVVIEDLERWLAYVRERNTNDAFMSAAELADLESKARVARMRRHLETCP